MSSKDTKQFHAIIRDRLKKYRQECLECLGCCQCGNRGYGTWEDTKRTLILLNKILMGIPVEVWPVLTSKDDDDKKVRIANNNWYIDLFWCNKRRHANLVFKRDDHTAWVVEHSKKKGVFVDFDIGGS